MLNKVLHIDDDEITLMMNELFVQKNAFAKEQVQCLNGSEALAYYADLLDRKNAGESVVPPDLIFLDLNMPYMNGWDFMESFCEIYYSHFPQTKVAILTSSVYQEDREKAATFSMIIGFFSKPMDDKMLVSFSKMLEK